MTDLRLTTVRGFLAVALLLSANFVRAGRCSQGSIHDRIEYKLNRVLRDVETIINGNEGNCTPITQLFINEGVGGGGIGTFTITASGQYCVTQNVTGVIFVNPGVECVCIDLMCHTVNADGEPNAFVVNGNEGVKIFNGCITNASDAAILVTDSTAVELFNLHIHDNANDSVRVFASTVVSVHDVDFVGGGAAGSALTFGTSAELEVARCTMTGFDSTSNSILGINDCDCTTVQNVDVCNNAFSGQVLAAGIVLSNSQNITVDSSHVYDSTTTVSPVNGILIDSCRDSKVIRSQMHRNANAGIELVGTNSVIALIENVAMENATGFEFVATSSASCCLVQDNRALSNSVAGFVHATSPLTTTFIGNEAQCNGAGTTAENFAITGGVIDLQQYSWTTGATTSISGTMVLGSRFTNISAIS